MALGNVIPDTNDARRVFFAGAGCQLSAVEMGNPDGPVIVMVHGMRDHALSLHVVAAAFADYRVILPDLRGHGDSDNPGAYAMVQMVADLEATFRYFAVEQALLVGHSLGGHICLRYSAVYPGRVTGLVLIDGMGPPRGPRDGAAVDVARWRDQVDALVADRRGARVMKDADEALARLTSNNQGLSASQARLIVDQGLVKVDGGVTWKWDPRVNMIWLTFSHAESETLCGQVECPVLLLTGDQSMEYWQANGLHSEISKAAFIEETDRRLGLFQQAEHVWIEGAGHMIQYDRPGELNELVRRFVTPLFD